MSAPVHNATLDQSLLMCVKKMPIIYDLNHPNYHISQIKQRAWVEVQEGVRQLGYNKDLNFLSKRWKYLRDYYMKLKKTQKTPVKWPYYNEVASIVERTSKTKSSGNLYVEHHQFEQQPSESLELPFIVKSSIVGNADEESVDIVYEPTAGEVVIDDPLEMVLPDHAYVPRSVPENESSSDESAWTEKSRKRSRGDSEDGMDLLKSTAKKLQLAFSRQTIPTRDKTKEDIFGEFVAKMLSEMDETTKRKHMRDIINILTS